MIDILEFILVFIVSIVLIVLGVFVLAATIAFRIIMILSRGLSWLFMQIYKLLDTVDSIFAKICGVILKKIKEGKEPDLHDYVEAVDDSSEGDEPQNSDSTMVA